MENLILVLAGVFVLGMLYLLPKYAKFINQMPKKHLEDMNKRAAQEKSGEDVSQPDKDSEK